MQWRKACDTNTCVEVLVLNDTICVRSSTDPTTSIKLTREEWDQFRSDIKTGAFDE